MSRAFTPATSESAYGATGRTEEANTYRDAMRKCMQELARTGKPWVICMEVGDSPPQSTYTQRIRRETLEEAMKLKLRRVAYVVNNVLTKQQVQRFNNVAGTESAYFETRSEAEDWLHQQPSK